MIDTDKYEGHTEGKDTWAKYANWATARYNRYADTELIADAPLLLEEVKRLREELYEYEKYSICHPDATHCCDECLERNGFEVKE